MSMSSVVNYTLAAWNTTKRNQDNDLADQDNIETDESMRHLSTLNQALISFLYVFGVGANICSLILLKRGETTRNGKQTLMVRCLIWNDLLALVGSFFLMYIQLYLLPGEPVIPRWLCILRVLLRTFGLSSGSVTTVMSVERWLALTRPFFYQKHINHKMIKVAIGTLWSISLLLVCLPFTGFGLYYDTDAPARHYTCVRYRFAVKTVDIAYAYFMFTFGIGFCVVIVFCNLTVVIVLSKVGKTSKGRMGRTTISRINRELFFNHTTHEEISFAKLMLILCVFFIMCWTPLMLTIIVAHWDKERKHKLFYRIADICMALNFILDPVIYVLSRRPYRRELKSLLKPFCLDCYPQLEWINSNGSRTFQRNSGYPWNIGMSAIYCKACQDEMSERHCSKHDHINPIFRVKDQLRHGKIEVRPNQKPVGDESRTSYTESQRKFLESIVVQIRIHDGQNSSVHMWNNKKKQWSKFNRKKCSCCKKNCYRDFFSDDYKTLGRTSVHVTGVSPLNYHSLPESLCKEYLANSCPSSFSNDKKTSDIDLNADTTPISSMTFHKRSNVYKRKSSSQYLSRHSSLEPSSSQLHHSEPTKLGSSTIYYRPKTPFLDISAINQYPLCSTLKYSTAKQRSELFMMRSSTIGHISERIKLTALTSDNHSTHTKMRSLSNGNHSEHISCMSSTTENHVESTKQ